MWNGLYVYMYIDFSPFAIFLISNILLCNFIVINTV